MSTPNSTELRTIIADVLAGIAPEASLDTIDPNGPFREELDIDSMDFLNLMVGLKGKLGVEVPEVDYSKLTTLNLLIAYLQRRLGG
jgi:acyl carrier protein